MRRPTSRSLLRRPATASWSTSRTLSVISAVTRRGSIPATRISSDRKSTRLNSSHSQISYAGFFFNDPPPTDISTLSHHDALPIWKRGQIGEPRVAGAEIIDRNAQTDVAKLAQAPGDRFLVDQQDAFSDLRGNAARIDPRDANFVRSEEHTSELQSQSNLVCRLFLQ